MTGLILPDTQRKATKLGFDGGIGVNNPRRKELERIVNAITELKEQLEILQEEEDEYRDNMPENLQGSERYEKAEAACENLYSAVSSLEETVDFINESMA